LAVGNGRIGVAEVPDSFVLFVKIVVFFVASAFEKV